MPPRAAPVGLVLGSGLAGLADAVESAVRIPLREIAAWPTSTVAGHPGVVVSGTLGGRAVIVMAGRVHAYEGHDETSLALPVRALHALGVETLLLSNAAGAIDPRFEPGDLMLIRDHINLLWRNPLIGPTRRGEARFPDMSAPYDPDLTELLRAVALRERIVVQEGTYAAVAGPSYETPAEIEMLRVLGAQAVGMSTVPEVLVARALGVRLVGVSCITNAAAGLSSAPLDHAAVLAAGAAAGERFARLVRGWVAALPA